MDTELETMYPEIQDNLMEAKTRNRRGNYMESLRLRGRTSYSHF